MLSVPSLAKYDPSRCCHDVPVNVPHECLSEEILEHPEILDEVEATQWPPAYYDNPIVRRDGRRVVPLALYLDGVPSTKRDGILGFWVYNLIARRRHLICVLRKSSLCKCGCGGWDSIYVVWRFLLWSLRAMSSGTFPNQRHDQLAWTDADAQRASLAGTPLGFTAMLLQIKGDWLEFCTTAGFVTWSHKQFPCMFCGAALDQIANFIGFGPFSPTYPLMKHADYEAACCACELTKHLTKEQWRLVKNCLAYDKTKKGSRGRALIRDLPSVGLQQGDRLEPDSTFQDVASFDNVESWPVRVTFWRRAVETRVKRRLPILQPDLGITLDTFCIDVLHCLYLGPMKDWCCAVLWAMVDYNVFGVAHANVDTRLPLTVLRIRELLWGFYNRWQEAHPGEDISRLEDLTPGMLGSSAHRNLSTKAMETKCLLPFCQELLETYQGSMDGALAATYAGIGDCCSRLDAVLRAEGFVVSNDAIQSLFDIIARLLRLWGDSGLGVKPKLHMLMHLADRAKRQGNPSYYSTWVDEGLNKTLASLGRQAHRAWWELRILVSFEQVQERASKRARM